MKCSIQGWNYLFLEKRLVEVRLHQKHPDCKFSLCISMSSSISECEISAQKMQLTLLYMTLDSALNGT